MGDVPLMNNMADICRECELSQKVQQLEEKNRALKQAGDCLAYLVDSDVRDAVETWHKAKGGSRMSEQILSEFMEALQHCDTVKVVLTGVGESQFKTKDIYLGISKLEEENAKLPDLRREIKELKAINKDVYEALDHLCIAAQKVCDDFCCGAGCSQDARDCKLEGGLIRAEIALRKARGETE